MFDHHQQCRLVDEAGRAACAGRRGEDDVGGELRGRQRRLEAGRAERLRSPRLAGRTTHTVKTHADKVDPGGWVRRHPSPPLKSCTRLAGGHRVLTGVERRTPVPAGQPDDSGIGRCKPAGGSLGRIVDGCAVINSRTSVSRAGCVRCRTLYENGAAQTACLLKASRKSRPVTVPEARPQSTPVDAQARTMRTEQPGSARLSW